MKKYIVLALCVLMVTTLVACNRKPTTNENFTRVVKAYNYEILSDETFESEGFGGVTQTDAEGELGSAQFITLSDEEKAGEMYSLYKIEVEAMKGKSSSESNFNIGNSSKYTLKSDGSYMYLCKIKNTVLYLRGPSDKKSTIKKVAKTLGY